MEDTPTPYEVRCHRCETSFPLGTRQCIHCGGRITRGARRPFPLRPAPQGAVPRTPEVLSIPGSLPGGRSEAERELDPEEFFGTESEREEEEAAASSGGPLRISLWTLSVGLALLGSMFRTCQGG